MPCIKLLEIRGRPPDDKDHLVFTRLRRASETRAAIEGGHPSTFVLDALGADVWLYFIGSADLVKIGITGGLPAQRCKVIQSMSPVPVLLEAVKPAAQSEERRLHQRFADFRSHGEWFRRSPDIIREIEAAVREYGSPTDNGMPESVGIWGETERKSRLEELEYEIRALENYRDVMAAVRRHQRRYPRRCLPPDLETQYDRASASLATILPPPTLQSARKLKPANSRDYMRREAA